MSKDILGDFSSLIGLALVANNQELDEEKSSLAIVQELRKTAVAKALLKELKIHFLPYEKSFFPPGDYGLAIGIYYEETNFTIVQVVRLF